MPTSKPTTVDEYMATLPAETQKVLKKVRALIRKIIPAAGEKISYGIPTFTLNDTYVIYLAGYKNHVSLYPAPRQHPDFKEELSAYKGGKGTVQFALDKALPIDLVTRIIQFRLKENIQKSKPNKK